MSFWLGAIRVWRKYLIAFKIWQNEPHTSVTNIQTAGAEARFIQEHLLARLMSCPVTKHLNINACNRAFSRCLSALEELREEMDALELRHGM